VSMGSGRNFYVRQPRCGHARASKSATRCTSRGHRAHRVLDMRWKHAGGPIDARDLLSSGQHTFEPHHVLDEAPYTNSTRANQLFATNSNGVRASTSRKWLDRSRQRQLSLQE